MWRPRTIMSHHHILIWFLNALHDGRQKTLFRENRILYDKTPKIEVIRERAYSILFITIWVVSVVTRGYSYVIFSSILFIRNDVCSNTRSEWVVNLCETQYDSTIIYAIMRMVGISSATCTTIGYNYFKWNFMMSEKNNY